MSVLTILCFIFWKESYAPIILARKAARLRKETGNSSLRSKYDIGLSPRAHLKRGIGRAVKMLLFSPIVLALSVYMGLIYAYFYLLFTTFTPIFEQNYHFPPSTVGLSYLGVGVGFLIGQASFAKLGDIILTKCAVRFGKGDLKPEYRLPLCCLGSFFVPIALFWYGWSVVGHVHWLVPIVGTGFIGLGNALIFVGCGLLPPNSPLSPYFQRLTYHPDRNPSLCRRRLHALRCFCSCGQHAYKIGHGCCPAACGTENV